MADQILPDLAVCLDCLTNQIRPNDVLFQLAGSAGGGGDQSLDFKLIGVGHEANQRLLVVGVAAKSVRMTSRGRAGSGSANRIPGTRMSIASAQRVIGSQCRHSIEAGTVWIYLR